MKAPKPESVTPIMRWHPHMKVLMVMSAALRMTRPQLDRLVAAADEIRGSKAATKTAKACTLPRSTRCGRRGAR